VHLALDNFAVCPKLGGGGLANLDEDALGVVIKGIYVGVVFVYFGYETGLVVGTFINETRALLDTAALLVMRGKFGAQGISTLNK
jgi:hypothetical protein